MLDDRAPSAWLASQTIQRTASAVGSSSVKAAVHARSAAASDRNLASSSMSRRSPSMWAIPASRVRRSAIEVATLGIGNGLLRVSDRW